jgi:hypothetical protein
MSITPNTSTLTLSRQVKAGFTALRHNSPGMPRHCLGDALAKAMRRYIAEQPARFPYVSAAVAQIRNTKRTMHGLDLVQLRVDLFQKTMKLSAEFVEGGLFAHRNIVDLIDRSGVVCRGGQ